MLPRWIFLVIVVFSFSSFSCFSATKRLKIQPRLNKLKVENKGLVVFFIASLNASTRDIKGLTLEQESKKDILIPRIIYDHVDYNRHNHTYQYTSYTGDGVGIPIYVSQKIEHNTFKSVYYLEMELPVGAYDFSLFFKGGKKKYNRRKKLQKLTVRKGEFHLIDHTWKSNKKFALNEIMPPTIRESYIACLKEFKNYVPGFPLSDSEVKFEVSLSLDSQNNSKIFIDKSFLKSGNETHYADVRFESFDNKRHGMFGDKLNITSKYSLRFRDTVNIKDLCYKLNLQAHVLQKRVEVNNEKDSREVDLNKGYVKVPINFTALRSRKNKVCLGPSVSKRKISIHGKRVGKVNWKFKTL